MYNHLTPEYLSSLTPQQVNEIAHYNLRNWNNTSQNESIQQFLFLPSVLRDWNTLSAEAKQLNTIRSFKYFLKKENKPVPKYYHYGKRNTQILHTWLWTGCSSLNLDLFLKNITDSPLCNCGSNENAKHYFSTADSFSTNAPYFLMIYHYTEHQLWIDYYMVILTIKQNKPKYLPSCQQVYLSNAAFLILSSLLRITSGTISCDDRRKLNIKHVLESASSPYSFIIQHSNAIWKYFMLFPSLFGCKLYHFLIVFF